MNESTLSSSAARANGPIPGHLFIEAARLCLGWIVVALILLVTCLVQVPVVLNTDLAWLLTVNEKILDGHRLGVDIFESNPPLSVYMYMPAAWLGRLTGTAPERIVILLVIAEIAGALLVIDRANAAAGLASRERRLMLWSFSILLASLPGVIFGQREHIAVVALTPFVAVTALRWRGLDPGRIALVAGAGAGLAMGIKPFFALAAGLPMICVSFRRGSWKALFTPEALTAALVAIGYGAVIIVVFPAYLADYAPMVADAYLPVRRDLSALLPIPVALLGVALAVLRLLAPEHPQIWRNAVPWLAAALGGAASFLLQGKGWPYTTFALCVFAISAPLLQLTTDRIRAPLAAGGLAAIVATGLFVSSPPPGFPPLQAHVLAHVPPLQKHPRLLTISDHIRLGHPLVREIDGVWVGSSCAQLLAAGAILQLNTSQPSPGRQARLEAIIAFERKMLLQDLRSGRPNVILVDTSLFSSFPFDWLAWANADPELRQELSRYREVEQVGRVRILAERADL